MTFNASFITKQLAEWHCVWIVFER